MKKAKTGGNGTTTSATVQMSVVGVMEQPIAVSSGTPGSVAMPSAPMMSVDGGSLPVIRAGISFPSTVPLMVQPQTFAKDAPMVPDQPQMMAPGQERTVLMNRV